MSERQHERSGFCVVCGASDPAIGSACVVLRVASAAHRMREGAERREILRVARDTTMDGLAIEAAHRFGSRVTLYVHREEAFRLHGRREVILTGLRNEEEET